MDKNLFDLYTDYLLASFGQTTATGLSQLVGGQISHAWIQLPSATGCWKNT